MMGRYFDHKASAASADWEPASLRSMLTAKKVFVVRSGRSYQRSAFSVLLVIVLRPFEPLRFVALMPSLRHLMDIHSNRRVEQRLF